MMLSKRSWLLILILLSLALNAPSLRANENAIQEEVKSSPALPAASDKEKESNSNSHAQDAQSSPSPSSETAIVVRDPTTEAQKHSANTETQNPIPGRTQEGLSWGSVPDWALVILAVITAVLGLRSLSDIAVQAKASRDSADTAEMSMVAGERAYIHYSGCRWISHKDISDDHIFWRIKVCWRNAGNTPTRGLRIYTHLDIRDDELPQDYAFAKDPNVKSSLAIIAPDGIAESGGWGISGTDLVAVASGKKRLYIWGTAVYRDVFPGTPEHTTKFCVFASHLTGDPMSQWHDERNPVDIAFASYWKHNSTDEDYGQDSGDNPGAGVK